jgi:hypothetical protein
MLKWKVCIAVAGRSLQAGRSLTIPWETPSVDARASPPGRPPGWTPASPPLNPQDPPNHLSHIPNGFESNVFLLFCPLILCPPVVLLFDPAWASSVMGSAMHDSTPLRRRTRLCCVRKCPAVGRRVPPRGSSRAPQGFDQKFPQRPPQRFPQSPPGAHPRGSQGCSPGVRPRVPPRFPSGFLTLGGVCSRRPQLYTCYSDACFCQGPGCEFRC